MADSIVEPSSSASVSSISSLMQSQQQAVNLNVLNPNIIPIISADIQVDTASSQSQPRPPPINQSANNNNNNDSNTTTSTGDEPDAKRKKLDATIQPSTSQSNEKLESRLGGILCCAVCLDLPKTMNMYQVGFHRQNNHFLFCCFFCSYFFLFLKLNNLQIGNFVEKNLCIHLGTRGFRYSGRHFF